METEFYQFKRRMLLSDKIKRYQNAENRHDKLCALLGLFMFIHLVQEYEE